MITQGPPAHVVADLSCFGFRDVSEMFDNLLRIGSHQYLASGHEECFDSRPAIGDQTSARSCGFKNSRGRRETDACHGIAIDVEHHAGRTIHAIVMAGANVANPAHVGRHWLALPAFTTERERQIRSKLSGTEEKLLHAALAVGQAMADKQKIASQSRI